MSAATLAIRARHAARRRHSASIRDLRADRHPNEPHSGPLRPLRAVGGTLWTPAGSALHGAWPRRPCLHIASRWAAASRPRRRLHGPEMVGTAYHSLDVLALSARLFARRRSHEPQKLPVHQTGSTPEPLAGRVVLQMGQAAPAGEALSGGFGERGQVAAVDRRVGLRAGCHPSQRLEIDTPLYTMLQILSVMPFEQVPLHEALTITEHRSEPDPSAKQLQLLDL